MKTERRGKRLKADIYLYVLVMAATTYLIRMIPVTFVKKEVTNPFIRSFVFYVPYVCLSAMTFPAILTATGNIISGTVGFLAALIAAYKEKSMVYVAVIACAAALITEYVLQFV